MGGSENVSSMIWEQFLVKTGALRFINKFHITDPHLEYCKWQAKQTLFMNDSKIRKKSSKQQQK